MSYATLDDLKQYLKIPSVTSEDVLLQTFLDEASAIIDEVIGHPSASSERAERTFSALDFAERGLLLFNGDYCVGIDTVTLDGVPTTEYTPVPKRPPHWGLLFTEYTPVPKRSPHWGLLFTGAPSAPVVVRAHWAYTTDPSGAPDALIKGACRLLAAWLYREKDNMGQVVASGDGVTVVKAALPRAVSDRILSRRNLV